MPEGWEVAEIRQHIKSNRGISYTSKETASGNGVPMINLNSFNIDSTYKPTGLKHYLGEYPQSKVLKPFDLVMCNTQQTALDPKKDIIGRSFLVPDIFDSDVVSSHHVTTISVKDENMKYYLNSFFGTEYFHRYISGYCTGTNILGLNFKGVLSCLISVPQRDLLFTYRSLIENVEKRRSVTITENQELATLRDWLLPMLMNGQVKVGAAKEILKAAEPEVGYGK